MNIYTTDKIRNVVLLGHGGAGKTSLVEAMGYLAGLTSRMGKVSDKNTISDYGKEEQKRQFSISTSVVPLEWEGCKINILDTPGYFDFVGEVKEGIRAADSAPPCMYTTIFPAMPLIKRMTGLPVSCMNTLMNSVPMLR